MSNANKTNLKKNVSMFDHPSGWYVAVINNDTLVFTSGTLYYEPSFSRFEGDTTMLFHLTSQKNKTGHADLVESTMSRCTNQINLVPLKTEASFFENEVVKIIISNVLARRTIALKLPGNQARAEPSFQFDLLGLKDVEYKFLMNIRDNRNMTLNQFYDHLTVFNHPSEWVVGTINNTFVFYHEKSNMFYDLHYVKTVRRHHDVYYFRISSRGNSGHASHASILNPRNPKIIFTPMHYTTLQHMILKTVTA
jgi:hypothetical protein